eukprot:TRINITY_DN51651_c0_g1_i4.p1 TRINITY_DN51651_c0_g1~~TRINITY_DN51651_c0_g1_i4.p1  ORF type:complete len:253 (+),score=8.75 TRINITY_DN51651_c0_g1_i4:353-1111(+)
MHTVRGYDFLNDKGLTSFTEEDPCWNKTLKQVSFFAGKVFLGHLPHVWCKDSMADHSAGRCSGEILKELWASRRRKETWEGWVCGSCPESGTSYRKPAEAIAFQRSTIAQFAPFVKELLIIENPEYQTVHYDEDKEDWTCSAALPGSVPPGSAMWCLYVSSDPKLPMAETIDRYTNPDNVIPTVPLPPKKPDPIRYMYINTPDKPKIHTPSALIKWSLGAPPATVKETHPNGKHWTTNRRITLKSPKRTVLP